MLPIKIQCLGQEDGSVGTALDDEHAENLAL